MPLGILEGETWQQGTVKITPGGLLVAYTDGITEYQNAKGEFFGEQRLSALAGADLSLPAEAMQARLLEGVTDFAGSAGQYDDMTLVVVKRR